MNTKRGVSLVILVITLIVMIILTSVIVMRTDNSIFLAQRNDFITELEVIQDKIKEYYLLVGRLPVVPGVGYNKEELLAKNSAYAYELENEIVENGDENNSFLEVQLSILDVSTNERGKRQIETDVFIVATNTLNVYYLAGFEIEDKIRFSLVTLVDKKEIGNNDVVNDEPVALNKELNVTKSTNTWTNEVKLTVDSVINDDETLTYFIGNQQGKTIAGNVITINTNTLTAEEKEELSLNKIITVNLLKDGVLLKKKQLLLDNFDITNPILEEMTVVDSSNSAYNIIQIAVTDAGGSGIESVYYDYATILKDGTEIPYYIGSSQPTAQDLIRGGKVSVDGKIKLEKHIKSISVVAVDNADNVSDVVKYTIDNSYLKSK